MMESLQFNIYVSAFEMLEACVTFVGLNFGPLTSYLALNDQ